jgi:hypothetical protein
MTQQELPFQRHSITSKAAAVSMRVQAKSLKEQVYDAIRTAGYRGLTDDEGQALLGMDGNTYRPRRVSLADEGRVYVARKIVTLAGTTHQDRVNIIRKTRAGRDAVVWRVG